MKLMSDETPNQFEVSVGDNVDTFSVGTGNSQAKAETHIHLAGLLDKFLSPPVMHSPMFGYGHKLDIVTIVIICIFCLVNVISVFFPLVIYQVPVNETTLPLQNNWLVPLTSAMSGITGLMGVLVGYRVSSNLKRQ